MGENNLILLISTLNNNIPAIIHLVKKVMNQQFPHIPKYMPSSTIWGKIIKRRSVANSPTYMTDMLNQGMHVPAECVYITNNHDLPKRT
jgi:hypothetical protein